jgi:CheY-like chemotaxis protein
MATEHSGKAILVVEDDAVTRDAMTMILTEDGYSVASAANGQEALSQLRAARRGKPNLILLDLMMPVMNGWEFCQEQQKDPALKSIPVIVVSADGNVPQKAASIGVADYLLKPVDVEALLATVRRYC